MEIASKHGSTLSSFLINKVLPYCQENEVNVSNLNHNNISNFIALLESGKVSKSSALSSLSEIILKSKKELNIEELAKKNNLIQSDDQDFLDQIIDEVIGQSPEKVSAYKNGKKGLLGFFMGQVMGKAKGKANPKVLNEKLVRKLKP